MSNPDKSNTSYFYHIQSWATWGANNVEDFCRAILGFIPDGLNQTYDNIFKKLPILGKLFAHKWVEKGLKLCTGITITQGLAADLAHFLFRPVGFIFGGVMGLGAFGKFKSTPTYQGKIGESILKFSFPITAGALFGIAVFSLIQPFLNFQYSFNNAVLALSIGAFLGLAIKILILIAMNSLVEVNALSIRKTVKSAKDLNDNLKREVKQKAKSKILMQAQDIIQQMNGPQSQQYLEEFFQSEYETIAVNTYSKLDRHFNYLTDRACHGDLDAFKRLQELNANPSAWDRIIDRVMNARAIFKLKDDVDTAYDKWQYRGLTMPA